MAGDARPFNFQCVCLISNQHTPCLIRFAASAAAGAGSLSHVCSDAVFLVRQSGSHFAFASPG